MPQELILAAVLSLGAHPTGPLPGPDPRRLRATVERLATWPNRNTNNPSCREAAEWIAGEFRAIPGVQVELMPYDIAKGPRVPEAKSVVQVVATLPGTDPELAAHRVLIGGHLDTINMQAGANLATAIAPGANDDASGVAAALECARVLAARPHRRTLMFVAFTGEEQGLLGSGAMAKRAKAEGWKLDAVLNNDMIGNAVSARGDRQNRAVRVFSEDVAEHKGRELARWLEWHQRSRDPRHRVQLVFRRDRFGRGGDHTPFNQQGFTAVRVVEVHEDYRHQHTDLDLPKFMDWGYLARNTALNLHALHALADAEAAPRRVRVDRAQSYESTLTWEGNPDQTYAVYWRETTSPVWQGVREVRGLRHTDPTHHKDDHIFAVGAVGGIPVVAE
ncbi:MAG: M20/M25/M40 family metallo-hydrolase [Fimbriimonadaceae bacterium]|nr:M20/M25/M40 family metallo-hydrolase [Fimbriimonadaceae bacterium]